MTSPNKLAQIVVCATVILVMSTGLAFTGGQAEGEEEEGIPEEIRIGWVPPDITGVFATATEYFERSAEDAREAGIDVEIDTQSPATHVDFGEQVDIIDDLVARNIDAIAISPTEVEVVIPALQAANDAGIPLVIVNLLEPIEGVEAASYVGFSNVDAGRVSGYALLDFLGGPGVLGEGETVDYEGFLDLEFWEDLYADVSPADADISGRVAIIEGIAGGHFSERRLEGFHEVIDPFEDIEVVTTLPADWNREKAVDVTEDILEAHDNLDAIWAASNEMGIGAQTVLEREGVDDQIKVITNDGTPESVDMIREGRLVAETWHGFPEWGWYGTRFAVMAVLGLEDQIPQQFDIRPRIVYEGNTDEFYPNVELEEHDWDSIIEAAQE